MGRGGERGRGGREHRHRALQGREHLAQGRRSVQKVDIFLICGCRPFFRECSASVQKVDIFKHFCMIGLSQVQAALTLTLDTELATAVFHM